MKDYKVYVEQDLEVLIPKFIENREEEVEKLKSMLEKNNFTDISRLGHAIKGTGGGYGFDKITDLGREIEQAAEQEDENKLEELIIELEDYIKNVEIIYE